MEKVGIGIIGCGNISGAYLKAMASFPILDIRGVADLNRALADAKAAEFNVPGKNIDELFADPKVEIIVNLTVPKAHVAVGLQALDAGKHTYSEMPLGINFAEGKKLAQAAKTKGLRIGAAPDTFLGGGHQTARALIDAGAIGQPVGGTATFMCPGHERWHPNPAFYYEVGGGPMLDMGPYYLTCLVSLLGPVKSVTGQAKSSYATRTIGSGPRAGQTIDVEVPTHISGLLAFENGAAVSITTSFDVWKHEHNHIELYATSGSMIVSDPNQFQGDIRTSLRKGDWTLADQIHAYGDGNYRILGLADMAQAIVSGREHRASLELSLHVLEIMEQIIRSAEIGQRIDLKHGCARPAPMRADLPFGILE
jgi:predicted dehydrogenase